MTSSSPAPVKVVAEYAKSGRSSCKKCSKAIPSSTLRLGLVSKDPRGFDMTRWHHLACFPFSNSDAISSSPESITGFSSLKSIDQESVKQLLENGAASEEADEKEDKEPGQGNLKRQKLSASEEGAKLELEIDMSASDVKNKYKELSCCLNGRHFRQSYFWNGMRVFMIQQKSQPLILMDVLQRHL